MGFINRLKLLVSYWKRDVAPKGLPVEYIVETTAKCNLYCPMCPREVIPQPKADMSDETFLRLVNQARGTAEHMMLIGLGEPFLDPKIFDRITYCEQHGISTLISTNGTLLTEEVADRLLRTPLRHITLSFDGASKETYERYRKGAKFELVLKNLVRFCRMKHERKARIHVVVQMVKMDGNAHEVDDFIRFWSAVPGVDQVRIKEDETRLLAPDSGHPPEHWKYPCHYLWRGPAYVKYNGDVYPCCQSYALGGRPIGNINQQSLEEIFNSHEIQRMRQLHACQRAGEIDICSRCPTIIPHPLLVYASLLFSADVVRRLLPLVEKAVYIWRLPGQWLKPPLRHTNPRDSRLDPLERQAMSRLSSASPEGEQKRA